MSSLEVSEVRRAIAGETSHVGLPCVLLRLTGCPLRCTYCDAKEAYQGGTRIDFQGIQELIEHTGLKRVLLTGGEPLAQVETADFVDGLVGKAYDVIVETSGALDISVLSSSAHRIVDIKAPSSGESQRMCMSNLDQVGCHDEVKFVVGDRDDFDFSVDIIRRWQLSQRSHVLLSPVYGRLKAALLARWILDEGIDARLNVQMHKLAFGTDGDLAVDPIGLLDRAL